MTLFSILIFCTIYIIIGAILFCVYLKFDDNKKLQAVVILYSLPLIMIGLLVYLIVESIGVLVGYNKHKRDYFTIHNLTAKNKNTLLEMGFEYGEFITVDNVNYKGYRYKTGVIVVLPNGRVNYSVKLEDEDKALLNIIKCLPSE